MFPEILPQAYPYVAAAFVLGYLCGSIPFGLFTARLFRAPDPRGIGSGNIGATNLVRAGGWKAGLVTLILDALKGAVPVLLAAQFGPLTAGFAAVGAAVGHCFPVWLKFRGGKAAATAMGAWWALFWPLGAGFCAVWLATALSFRRSSLAALAACLAPAAIAYFGGWYEALWPSIALAALLIARHHANIGRLIRGEEPPIKLGRRS